MNLFQGFGPDEAADYDGQRQRMPRGVSGNDDPDSGSSSEDDDDDEEEEEDDDRVPSQRGGGAKVILLRKNPSAMEDDESSASDDDDDDDDDDIPDMPMSYAGIMGHNSRPFRGIPDSWTVYEAFSMVVPHYMLAASKHSGFPVLPTGGRNSGEATWGAFVGVDPQAEAAKRLLFLMLAAVNGAIVSETGDPEHLPPPGATAKTKRSIEQKAKAANEANPKGVVAKRPRGVAGASSEPSSFLSRMRREMLSPPVSGPNKAPVWSLPSQTRGVFILQTAGPDSPQLLARRISIVIEELMSPCARTVGWRWWFLVHDPRISLPQWITRTVEDNHACRKMRMDKIRKSKEAGSRSSLADPRAGASADSPECHQSIYDVRSYAKVVREYWGGMGCPPNAAPRADNHALARGIAAPATSLHPARVFSPQVATEIDWVCNNVCEAQRNIRGYVNPDTSLLGGSFPRPARTTTYDPSVMTPEGVNEMPLPERRPDRAKIIDELLWDQLEYWCERGHVIDSTGGVQQELPDYLITAVQNKNMAETTRILDRIRATPDPSFDSKRFMEIVRNSVTEDLLEAKEGAAYAMEAEERHTAKRRRMNDAEDDPFGVDLAAQDAVGDVQMLDPDDTDSQHTEAFPESITDEAIRGVPETTMSHARQFDQLMSVEEPGSRLNMDLIRRDPLLYLRMVHNTELMQIRETYEMGTPEYRVAMDSFRSQAMTNFVTMLMNNLENEEALSKPVRYGVQFLLGLSQRPNYIRRHAEWLHGQRMARQPTRGDADSPEAAKRFFLNTMQQQSTNDEERRPPSAAVDPAHAPPLSHGLWHEWPAFGAMDLGAYDNYRLMLGARLSRHLRCKPGEESTNLLYRLVIMQGTAWWYHWGMHGDQLLWGPGGVGKSYLFDCLRAQAFNGQIESADNLTPKWCAVGSQYPLGDTLMIVEEAPPRVVGQDDEGKPHPGDELIKTLLTSHFIETIEPYIDKETKKRTMMKSQAMLMVTFFVATNLVIQQNLRNGGVSPAIRRFMMSHVTLPTNGGISLSKINNPLSTENQTREQTEFLSQLKVINALCMLVEKLIQTMVLSDVNMDVWSVHSSWFFDEVARVCKVPPATMSNREHLAAACRQVAIRYAVHKVFFTETAAKGVRCRTKTGDDSSNPEDWVPARFDFHTLLRLQGHLVVTEAMVIDVISSMRTTYIPTTSWRVVRCMKKIVQKIRPSHRRVTQATLWLQHNEDHDEGEEPALGGLISDSDSSDSDSDSSDGDEEAGAGNDTVLIRSKNRKRRRRRQSDGQKVCSDKNYYAFQYPSVAAALDYFTSQTTAGLDRDVFYQVLIRQLSHELISHTDRNRPKRDEDPETGQSRVVLDPDTRRPIYDKVIKSPIVVVEKAPFEDSGDHHSSAPMMHGGTAPVQICILIEYLEQDRQDSLNDIIKRGFSYRGQRRRKVLTACGTQERIPVKESGGADREDTAVAIDYMGTVLLEPNPDHRLVRINHFPRTTITDTFVDNESLHPERDGTDLGERLSLEIDGYLDEIIIDHHLNYCGLPVSEEYYPWVHTEKLRDIVMSKKDPIGIPVSARWKQSYPDSFRGIYRRASARESTDQDGSTTTTTTEEATAAAEPCHFSAYLRQSRRKRRREDF